MTTNNESESNGIPFGVDELKDLMNIVNAHRPQGETPLQGWDFTLTNWNQPYPTGFNIDFMAETLWITRALMFTDIEFLPLGKRPVPETIFIRVVNPNPESASNAAKTIILHTTGWAQFIETRVDKGTSCAEIELCIDINSIEVVNQNIEDTEEV
jgi:hypothetical protein